MCEKALHDVLLEIAGLSSRKLASATDPSVLACCRALTAVSVERGQEHVFATSILTCLEQLASSTHSASCGGTIASVSQVMEKIDGVLAFLRALKDRYVVGCRLMSELVGPTSCSSGECLQSLIKLWQEKIGSLLSSLFAEASDGLLAVWGKIHCLLVLATSCLSMDTHAKRILVGLHADQFSWTCLSTLTPALEHLLPHTPQALPLVVEELSERDEQCLVCSQSSKLMCVDSQQTKVLVGSAYLTDLLEVSLRVCVSNQFTVTGRHDLLHCTLLAVQTYTGRLIQVTGRVPHSAPLSAWYVVISSLAHLHTRISDVCSQPHLPDSMEELPRLCQWLSQQCEVVVNRTASYHQQLCFSLLHDADSHDWKSSRPFCEGSRVSFPIQAWHLHLKALLHDLTNHTPNVYSTRVSSAVMVGSLTILTDYYVQLEPSPPRMQQYRADLRAILVIVASLLPSLFSLEDPSPDLKLIHNCCSSLARTLLATGDSSGSWQHCVDLAHFGLHPVQHGNPASQLVSLVLLQRKQWGLLVELLLQSDYRLAVELCRHGLLSSCAHLLAHCHHQPSALAMVFSRLDVRVTQRDSVSSAGLSWLSKFLRPLLQRPVLDAAIGFTVSMIHHGHQPITAPLHPVVVPVLVELLGQLVSALNALEPPLKILLRQLSSGQNGCSAPLLLGTLLDGALELPEWMQKKVWPPIGQWWEVFSQLIAVMCGREELSAARDLSQFRACVQADEVQERLHDIAAAISAEGEGDYPQAMDCKDRNVQSLLHSTAAEVIRAEERGREAMLEVLGWVTANQAVLMELLCGAERESVGEEEIRHVEPHPVLFDPVDACCSLGTKQFDHQHFLQHMKIM